MDREQGDEINPRVAKSGSDEKSGSGNSEAAISDEIADSNAKSKEEVESKCPSHVIDIKCDGLVGENQVVCRICHLNAKETGNNSMELIELGCGCKGELRVAHLLCAEAWFKVRGNRY